ncbi:unnamed protein product [Caenorhabditis nigoni]
MDNSISRQFKEIVNWTSPVKDIIIRRRSSPICRREPLSVERFLKGLFTLMQRAFRTTLKRYINNLMWISEEH